MAVLTPSPKMQFESAAGVPLSGGKLYTYTAGTTTPLATYTDATGATPNPNPVILDSRGEAAIWLGAASYKFKLTDANDVEIWTVDYISAPTSGVSPILSGNVTIDSDTPGPALKITQTGTGPVMRVQDSADPDSTPFIIDSDGQVGVGTATPAAPLDVTGAARLGSLTLTSAPLPIASGGTNATTASAARTSLGVAINTDVIGYVAPGASGNVLLSDGTNWTSSPRSVPAIAAGDSGKALINNGTVSSWDSSVIRGTSVASTSGTTVDFTGIPSWVRRITMILRNVSTDGGSPLVIRIGSGSFLTTGYASGANSLAASSTTGDSISSGFALEAATASLTAASVREGIATLTNVTGNVWVMASTLGYSAGSLFSAVGGGSISLSGALDRVRLTTPAANTFDGGTVNIFWE